MAIPAESTAKMSAVPNAVPNAVQTHTNPNDGNKREQKKLETR